MKSTGIKLALRDLFGYAGCKSVEIVTRDGIFSLFYTDFFSVNEVAEVIVIQNEIMTTFVDFASIQYIQCKSNTCKRKFADRPTKGITFKDSISHD